MAADPFLHIRRCTMKQFRITDLKPFTSSLFVGSGFDDLLLYKADITTGISASFDGALKKDFYDDDEWELVAETGYACWAQVKPLCFDMIKGKKLPVSFRISLMLPKDRAGELKAESRTNDDISVRLFLNIIYEHGILTCTTGVASSVFPPDRLLEDSWDAEAYALLRSKNITLEEI